MRFKIDITKSHSLNILYVYSKHLPYALVELNHNMLCINCITTCLRLGETAATDDYSPWPGIQAAAADDTPSRTCSKCINQCWQTVWRIYTTFCTRCALYSRAICAMFVLFMRMLWWTQNASTELRNECYINCTQLRHNSLLYQMWGVNNRAAHRFTHYIREYMCFIYLLYEYKLRSLVQRMDRVWRRTRLIRLLQKTQPVSEWHFGPRANSFGVFILCCVIKCFIHIFFFHHSPIQVICKSRGKERWAAHIDTIFALRLTTGRTIEPKVSFIKKPRFIHNMLLYSRNK